MNISDINTGLFSFLGDSPTPYHCVQTMKHALHKQGYTLLQERDEWQLKQGNSYMVSRDDGSLIAFHLGSEAKRSDGFRMLGSHSDSPCLKVKPQPGVSCHSYRQLGVEVYGGPLLHPWFDRELSLAGRVVCTLDNGQIESLLVDFERPVCLLPSLAIHFDREANTNHTIHRQDHLKLLFTLQSKEEVFDFNDILLTQIQKQYPGKKTCSVMSHELFCYDTAASCVSGLDDDFIAAPRLDNLLSCYIGLLAMTTCNPQHNTLFICTNHEEIGSRSASGALGSFPATIIHRILPNNQDRARALSQSLLISLDNAHALHPNHGDMTDPTHPILLNVGPVIKNNANQKYATNSQTAAAFKIMADDADIEVQDFVMRSDLACGSTIGPLTSAQLGIPTIDVGVATLGMHSIREMTGSKDPWLMYKVIENFIRRKRLPGEPL